jgi:hypothetical protein
MANRILSSCLPALVLAAGLLGATFPAAGSQLPILTIDESDPTAVTITVTGNNATGTDGSTTANYGVDIASFFTAGVAAGPNPTSAAVSNPVGG